MNKEEKIINKKCNFIDNLLLDNSLYKGVSALVEIEEHISNLYDEIDEYKCQLEEKDNVIKEIKDLLKEDNISYAYESLESSYLDHESLLELKEILERGKNVNSK